MTAILRLQLDDKDPVRVNSAINQLAEYIDRNPVPVPSASRTLLTANTTFYVATTGSDANPGTSGSPFLTIQHAYNLIVSTIDTAGFTATIQLADGTYTAGLAANTSWTGGGSIVLNGNASTPSNVVISTTGTCINLAAPAPAMFQVKNLKVTSSASNGTTISSPGTMSLDTIVFGACAGVQMSAQVPGTTLQLAGPVTITGGGQTCILAQSGGGIFCNGKPFTLTGTPAYSLEFVGASTVGSVIIDGSTFTGTATGTRYFATINGVIYTAGAGATYLPGNAAGATAAGGQYV